MPVTVYKPDSEQVWLTTTGRAWRTWATRSRRNRAVSQEHLLASVTSPAALPAARQQEEPHDLHRPDRQLTEIVDVGGAGDAKGHCEPSDERGVREVPEKGKGRPAHAKPTLEKPKQPMLATDDGARASFADEAEKGTDDPEGHLPSTHDLDEPGEAEAFNGLALVSERCGRHAGKGGIIAPATDNVARVGGLPENACPEV